jgi:tRNA-N(6)-(isopentenyl)adenosine-37 thiotransferase enzyme MiaB
MKIFNGPDLSQARKRSRQETQVIKDSFDIPSSMQNIGEGQTYFIRTYGCQANERDSETLRGILEAMGYVQSDVMETSQIIILNTCAIRENAEQKVFGKIGNIKNLKQKNEDVILAICGCMAQEESVVNAIMTKYPHVDLVFGTHNLHRLPQLLESAMASQKTIVEVWSKEGDVVEDVPVVRNDQFKAWVNIMYGCDKFCTYCIVPYTRGKERSRKMEDILAEVNDLKAKGYQEITLLGQNVNAYGKDLAGEIDFATLLEATAKTGIPRIRFTTSHPWDFNDRMIDMIASYDNLMPFIHLPVQSGDNDVLKLMGRKYTIEQYKELFDKIKTKIPNCAVSTDIIVGFPNETEQQYQHTLDIVNYCKYDNAYTFIYSPRIGTPAAKMQDNVAMSDKEQRLYRLNELVNQYAWENNQKYLGQKVKVLVEGPSKKNPDVLTGYTESQKLVNFKGDFQCIGKIVTVEITEANTWSLKGKVILE